jgi:hypothetical protein
MLKDDELERIMTLIKSGSEYPISSEATVRLVERLHRAENICRVVKETIKVLKERGANTGGLDQLPLAERVRWELEWRYAVRTGKTIRTPEPCKHPTWRYLDGLGSTLACGDCATVVETDPYKRESPP